MEGTPKRSACPIAFALDLLGDRWTLLVVRDLALGGKHTFSEMLASDEGIATNILADRLARLERNGLVRKRRDPRDGRRFRYDLTAAGVDLLPALVELIAWAGRQDPCTAVTPDFLRAVEEDRDGVVARYRAALEGEADLWSA